MALLAKLETLRKALIIFNIAPIAFGCFMGWVGWQIVKALIDGPEMNPALATILAGLATGVFGFSFKIYETVQKNRKDDSSNQ